MSALPLPSPDEACWKADLRKATGEKKSLSTRSVQRSFSSLSWKKQNEQMSMILPIVAYGDPILRKTAKHIASDYPGLSDLVRDMFETMYNAHGVGLAAPQIGKSVRLFIVDASIYAKE